MKKSLISVAFILILLVLVACQNFKISGPRSVRGSMFQQKINKTKVVQNKVDSTKVQKRKKVQH
jgi:hypothetical protein